MSRPHVFDMDDTAEDYLFKRANSREADSLRKQAKKLKRAEDRKNFWTGRKQEKRNGQ